jgi:hypothetical protein
MESRQLKKRNNHVGELHDLKQWGQRSDWRLFVVGVRACSYDPAYRDVSLTETNISVRSYGIFRPACRDENTL